jgi:manganese transport protein
MGGQIIMQGFFRRRIPIWLRRLVTMLPSFVVVAMGVGTTEALVVSQVILSLTLPVPMIALIILTSNKAVMGEFVNRGVTRFAAIAGASIVLLLNAVLLYKTFIGA